MNVFTFHNALRRSIFAPDDSGHVVASPDLTANLPVRSGKGLCVGEPLRTAGNIHATS